MKKIKWVQKRPTAIIVDIDGTIANKDNRCPYDMSKVSEDSPRLEIIDIVEKYKDHAHILLVTGRDASCKKETEAWLMEHNVPYNHLFMREEGNNEKDTVIKKRVYDEKIKDIYNVLFVLDDRTRIVKMWRETGLTCLQVADGDF